MSVKSTTETPRIPVPAIDAEAQKKAELRQRMANLTAKMQSPLAATSGLSIGQIAVAQKQQADLVYAVNGTTPPVAAVAVKESPAASSCSPALVAVVSAIALLALALKYLVG